MPFDASYFQFLLDNVWRKGVYFRATIMQAVFSQQSLDSLDDSNSVHSPTKRYEA